MKKIIILFSALSSVFIANAQWSAASLTTPTFRMGPTGIGTTSPSYFLHVADNGNTGTAGFFDYSPSGTSALNSAVRANVVGSLNTQQIIALNGSANFTGGSNTKAFGYYGIVSGGSSNYGVYVESGSGSGVNVNAGVFANLMSNNATDNYAIYGSSGGMSNAGLDTWAGYFDGDIMVTGTPYSTGGGPFTASDSRFKKNVVELENISEKLCSLNSYHYEFKTDEFKSYNFPQGVQYGLIAQELKEVFPQLVSNGPDGYNFVNYTGMIPLLLQALKEQKARMDELLKTSVSTGITANTLDGGVMLQQNIPNPFTHETIINYNLPDKTSNAAVTIYDLTGKQITSYPLTDKNASSLTITSEKLAAGIYIYSIIADGQLLDSKRMIVAEK